MLSIRQILISSIHALRTRVRYVLERVSQMQSHQPAIQRYGKALRGGEEQGIENQHERAGVVFLLKSELSAC